MRKILFILFILNFISCSTSKVGIKEIVSKTSFNDLKLVKTSKIFETDTITFNELRFYKIDSALDAMKSMYIDYGTWHIQDIGLHQDNINRKVWVNIKLFENEEVYTIVADGTETIYDYYACIIVFDSEGKDCFDDNYPLKNKIINLFYERMKENRSLKMNYFIF